MVSEGTVKPGATAVLVCADRRGSKAGYSRHRRAGQDPCPECRAGRNAHHRESWARRKAQDPTALLRKREQGARWRRRKRIEKEARAMATEALLHRHSREFLQLFTQACRELTDADERGGPSEGQA